MLKRIYDWCVAAADKPYALWILAAVAFAESSFFPIPPDIMLLPMSLARPKRAWWFAAVCTVASVAGGVLGYAIGALLYDSLGQWLIHLYGLSDKVDAFRASYAEWGAVIILLKGLTPIPYKLVTITLGLCRLQHLAVHPVLDRRARRPLLLRRGAAQPLWRCHPRRAGEAARPLGRARRNRAGAGLRCRIQADLTRLRARRRPVRVKARQNDRPPAALPAGWLRATLTAMRFAIEDGLTAAARARVALAGLALSMTLATIDRGWAQAAPPALGVQSPAQQPVEPQQPQQIELPPAPVEHENPGADQRNRKTVREVELALPPLKSPSETFNDLSNLARPSTMVSGRAACAVSANGAPDCKVGADRLCQSNGYKEGKGIDIATTEKCSPLVYLAGPQARPERLQGGKFRDAGSLPIS